MTQRTIILTEIHQLADEMGDFIVYWGFKKVHGRIWTHLVLSDVPLDASDLMQRLAISKALVSMSLGELLALRVIEETRKSERGTQLYQANPEILNVLMTVLRLREREMLARLHKAARTVKRLPAQKHKRHGICSQNIHALNNLIEVAESALESFLKNLRFDMSAARNFPLSQPGVKRAAQRR